MCFSRRGERIGGESERMRRLRFRVARILRASERASFNGHGPCVLFGRKTLCFQTSGGGFERAAGGECGVDGRRQQIFFHLFDADRLVHLLESRSRRATRRSARGQRGHDDDVQPRQKYGLAFEEHRGGQKKRRGTSGKRKTAHKFHSLKR